MRVIRNDVGLLGGLTASSAVVCSGAPGTAVMEGTVESPFFITEDGHNVAVLPSPAWGTVTTLRVHRGPGGIVWGVLQVYQEGGISPSYTYRLEGGAARAALDFFSPLP